jgi:3-oxoacyl-[acyl-carrier protein] reductase
MFPEPRIWTAEQLRVGLHEEFERALTEDDVLGFARTSGDYNPLHVDAAYALASNFHGRIVHGAFQVALASALIGMRLPGMKVLLGSVNARFPAPLYFPCRVCVRGEITSWDAQLRAGQLRVTVRDTANQTPTADIQIGFTLHEQRSGAQQATPSVNSPSRDERAVLVTGASGGIGAALVQDLAHRYFVFGMVRQHPLPAQLKALKNVAELKVDLESPSWEEEAAAVLGDRPLYGIVHAAWPGAPHGGLLRSSDDLLEGQMRFGSVHLVRLARLLFARADDRGGRLVAIGSIVGARPTLSLAAYSLGKAALESTVRLLAPEMARKKVTVNAVCPSFVPVGINKQANERQQKMETAHIPLGRLCTPADLSGAVDYLFSPAASFISGQILGLFGGQL